MRDELLGYLLGALEPAERETVEAQLRQDAELRRELRFLEGSLVPLAQDREVIEPPLGLAARTSNYVAARARGASVLRESVLSGSLGHSSAWRMQDWLVAAGLFIAASMLLFPAISHSRFNARLTACQNNLRLLGKALWQYSDFHNDYFPAVPERGNLAVAGYYAAALSEAGLLESPSLLVCPASSLAERQDFTVPTTAQLLSAAAPQLVVMHRDMGGSYGYPLPYVDVGGNYRWHRNLDRSTFALMADAPDEDSELRSLNHGTCGQNVLFEDGHASFMKACRPPEVDDHIYRNAFGEIAAGIGPNDSVLARSPTRPIILKRAVGSQ